MNQLIAVLSILLFLASPVAAQTISRVAAVVNDEVITTYQLEKELAAKSGGGNGALEGDVSALRKDILSALIEETLIRQKIDKLGLKVEEAELEAAMEDIQRQNKLTRDQLKEALQLQGMSFTEYRENLRQQILRFKLISREVQSKVEVNSQEIRDYFRDHIAEYREEPTVRLSRILFPVPKGAGEKEVQAVRSRAEIALADLRRGEEFATVLNRHASEGTAGGGDLGTFADGELMPTLAVAIRNLGEGEVSGIVETSEGLQILKVTERSSEKIQHFDSVKDQIRKVLLERKTEERFKEWATGLKKDAFIDVKI